MHDRADSKIQTLAYYSWHHTPPAFIPYTQSPSREKCLVPVSLTLSILSHHRVLGVHEGCWIKDSLRCLNASSTAASSHHLVAKNATWRHSLNKTTQKITLPPPTLPPNLGWIYVCTHAHTCPQLSYATHPCPVTSILRRPLRHWEVFNPRVKYRPTDHLQIS